MSKKYDVIVIGAGIGGLVAGCYLAKAGMKVLILEQHVTPGGYCASFRRNGYTFDTGVHYLGAGRKDGYLGKLITELALNDEIKFKRCDPSDKVIVKDYSFRVRANSLDTLKELKDIFREEKKALDSFYEFITTKHFYNLYARCMRISFKDLLDSYFQDTHLKAMLSALLGNIGLPSNEVSAISAVALFREFIFDSGYYPIGGMQEFSNALTRVFQKNGGEILFNKKVERVIVRNQRGTGVAGEGFMYNSDYIVSAMDVSELYKTLLTETDKDMLSKVEILKPSCSAFAVFLGVDGTLDEELKDKCSTWFYSTYEVDRIYSKLEENITDPPKFILCMFPSKHDNKLSPEGKTSMVIFSAAPFKNIDYWKSHRDLLADRLIDKACEIIPNLKEKIEFSNTATPHTYSRYTGNRNGAMYGWACTQKQISADVVPQLTSYRNIFLAGHWCTNGVGQGGVSAVIYSGVRASRLLIKENKK